MLLRRIGLAMLVALGAPLAAHAQYFGQNKVQYTAFDFKVLKTEHFDIYFYERERAAALDAGRMAERAYARLSRVLNHEFKERKPIILYASHSDFQQTNALSGDIGEATGGVTDFFKHRAVLPFTGSYAEFEHVLQHEMVHQFQYDTWSRGRAGGGLSTLIQISPPLWFAEGMAEYLSIGPINAETAMWLRDAALEGKLPTIQQLTTNPYIFPYRYGHAIWSFIGERWGDEAVGAILQGTLSGGVDGAIRRVLGITVNQLSDQWRDEVQKRYLPEIGNRVKARAVANPLLTKERSDGTLHVAPALSPDGSLIAYLSEKDFYFVDLYLADGHTGRVKRRLVKSTFNANYETLRFLTASANWSPDGKYLVLAAKREAQDDIVIIDVERGNEHDRIRVNLNGVTGPAFSPDGRQIVFSGQDGGLSDLYIVNVDGSGLRRLTNDKYAELQPAWSPNGKTIAFVTDRGPKTDFETLAFGNLRIALYHLDSGTLEVLPRMEEGKNISPQWAPDGRSLAFVSDRTGISNIFLHELDGELYQLTDFYTGAQSVTPLSPVLSWARDADRLAFVYYEKQNTDVYTITNPRSLRRRPYEPPARDTTAAAVAQAPTLPAINSLTPAAEAASRPQVQEGGTIYRTPTGFRAAGQVGEAPDSVVPPVSIVALLDSAQLALPDTTEFSVRKYKAKLSPDYVARPSIGYTRDNFGRGFSGGSAVALSDILGNHQLLIAGYLNGRLSEAQVLVSYANLSRRINWAVGVSQEPYFFLEPSQIVPGSNPNEAIFQTNIRRLVVRSAFGQAYYPLNRFQRLEAGMRLSNVDDAILSINEPFDPTTGFATGDAFLDERSLPGVNYFQPSVALAFDNSLFGWVGPFYGKRYRLEVAQVLGDWQFTQGTADYRRYDNLFGPFTLATRGLYFGRIGPDADRFLIFLGSTDLLRGNTSGSYRRNECLNINDPGTQTGCAALDQLVGTQLLMASAELRFPLLNASLGFVPIGFPPIEGALFYEAGVIWDQNSTLKFSRDSGDDPVAVRTPLTTLGVSIRANVLGFVILRADYSFPQQRDIKGFWTISIGPTF